MKKLISLQLIDVVIIFTLGMLLFTSGLKGEEIVGFETRFYLFAKEMWQHGFSLFPTTYGKPYPDYPGTAIWLMTLSSHIFGNMNKFSVVLPSALASACTLSLTYLIGAKINRRIGWQAVLLLLFTVHFIIYARTICLDQYVTLAATLSFYIVFTAFLNKKVAAKTIILACQLFGFAFRGPIGAIIPAAVVIIFYIIAKQYRRMCIISLLSGLQLIVCHCLLLLLAIYAGGMSFAWDVIHMQILGRMANHLHSPSWYYYLTNGIGGYALPFPLCIGIILSKCAKKNRLMWFFIAWAGIILCGMSIPHDKKLRYILSMAPALSLLSSIYLHIPDPTLFDKILRKIFYGFCFLFPFLLFFALVFIARSYLFIFPMHWLWLIFLINILLFFFARKKIPEIFFYTALLTFLITMLVIVEPLMIELNKANAFVHKVELLRKVNHASLIFYREVKDELPIKYKINMSSDALILFADKKMDLQSLKPPCIVITRVNFSKDLKAHFQWLMQGRLGHVNVDVFSCRD